MSVEPHGYGVECFQLKATARSVTADEREALLRAALSHLRQSRQTPLDTSAYHEVRVCHWSWPDLVWIRAFTETCLN